MAMAMASSSDAPPSPASLVRTILDAAANQPTQFSQCSQCSQLAHFTILGLPAPTIDALHRPHWPVSQSEITKAYRARSRLVHPDKVHDESLKAQARNAFEAVKASYAALSDESSREEVLRAYAAAVAASGALADRHNDKTLVEKVDAMGKELDERKRLREEEYTKMTDEIQRQVEEKRRRAQLVREKRKEREEREEVEGSRRRIEDVITEIETETETETEAKTKTKTKTAMASGKGKTQHDDSDDDDARRRRRQQNRRRERKKK